MFKKGDSYMIKVAVCGACGRMGQRIVKTVSEKEDMEIVAALDEPGTSKAGEDIGNVVGIGKLDIKIGEADEIEKVLRESKPEVLVDFTVAEAAVQNVNAAAKAKVPVVVGTTGFSDEQRAEMEEIIKNSQIPAVIAPNMSVGVNVFFKLVEEAAEKLKEYDMELVEAHHNKKVDAPSGTALTAAKIAAESSGKDFEKAARFGRPKGNLGERPENEIGIHSIRAGDIAGDHDFIFAGPSERLEIVHRAQSRQAFVGGVIKAIRHIAEEGEPGEIQDMQDVLFGEEK